MKLSTLRIEPHIVKPDTSREYYARQEGVALWHVWLDEKLLTNLVHPFSGADRVIQLTTDGNFPYVGEGTDYVSVRRAGQYILWVPLLEHDWDMYGKEGIEEIYIFSVSHYEAVCKEALVDTTNIDKHYQQRERDVSWQMLDASEFKELLRPNYPDWIDDLAIYRIPESRHDATGSIIRRKMKRAIESMTSFAVCDAPEKQLELHIGLDDTEFKEAIWHIGKVAGNFAVWFEKYPSFPLWLQSAVFDTVFNEETFVKELA